MLFIYGLQPHTSMGLLDVASSRKTEWLKHPDYDLYKPRFSPDGRWIGFIAETAPGRLRVFVAPFEADRPPAEKDWIGVTGEHRHDKPEWSPDGNLLYFTSDRDGFQCIWAQRLTSAKQPVGPPLEIYHSHSARRSLTNVGVKPLELAVGPDKLVFTQGEITGNIWMAKLEGQK